MTRSQYLLLDNILKTLIQINHDGRERREPSKASTVTGAVGGPWAGFEDQCVLGVDVGGTRTRAGLIDGRGRILSRSVFPTMRGPLSRFGDAITAVLRELLHKGAESAPIGLGIGLRGIVNVDSQRYVRGSLFSDAEDYDLRAELSNALNLPVLLGNDVNAAALAEFRWGVGRRRSSFCYVNIGTGIGAAVMDRGHLLRGAEDAAGEIGNYIFSGQGTQTLAHSLESVVSGFGFDDQLRRLANHYPGSLLQPAIAEYENVQSTQIFQAFQDSDPLAMGVVDNAVCKVAEVLVNLEAIAGSGCYVFGGGVLSDAAWFLDLVEEKVKALCEQAGLEWSASMQISSLGPDDGGLLGAAALALASGPPATPTVTNTPVITSN